MDVEVKAALEFKTAGALEKAILAFDDQAYQGFFDSGIWARTGAYATCDTGFEIEPDCDYERAFRTIAKTAIGGTIELRDRREKTIARFDRQGSKWQRSIVKTFGGETKKLLAAWKPKLAAASADVAAAETKAAKAGKATNVAIDVGLNVTAAAWCADGNLAIATPKRVRFYTPAGKQLAEHTIDDYAVKWLSDLHALPTGGVVAFNREAGKALAIVTRERATIVNGFTDDGGITGNLVDRDGVTVAWGGVCVNVLDKGKLRRVYTAKDGQIFTAMPWQGGVLASTSDDATFHTIAGKQRWSAKADAVISTPELAITSDGSKIALRNAAGKAVRTLTSKGPGRAPSFQMPKRAWVVEGDRLFVANDSIEEWDLTTGKLVARAALESRFVHLCGCARVAGMTAVWADRPILDSKDRDSRVMFVSGDKIVDSFDAKSDVLEGINLDDHTLAVRTKTKIFVWRDGKVQTLGGQRGIAAFCATPTGLISVGTDKTVRVWTL
ncbi:MAG: hypothetical protein QM831_10380 [Kofleriaceae bacterium]